jgi:hypothetical protein
MGGMKNLEILVSNKIDWLPMILEWASLKTVIMVHSKRTNRDQTGEEKRYYFPTPTRMPKVSPISYDLIGESKTRYIG